MYSDELALPLAWFRTRNVKRKLQTIAAGPLVPQNVLFP